MACFCGGGPGRGQGTDSRQAADMEVFHYLLENHTKIERNVKELPNGVETMTESDGPQAYLLDIPRNTQRRNRPNLNHSLSKQKINRMLSVVGN